jgi:hypothetical protein
MTGLGALARRGGQGEAGSRRHGARGEVEHLRVREDGEDYAFNYRGQRDRRGAGARVGPAARAG